MSDKLMRLRIDVSLSFPNQAVKSVSHFLLIPISAPRARPVRRLQENDI